MVAYQRTEAAASRTAVCEATGGGLSCCVLLVESSSSNFKWLAFGLCSVNNFYVVLSNLVTAREAEAAAKANRAAEAAAEKRESSWLLSLTMLVRSGSSLTTRAWCGAAK